MPKHEWDGRESVAENARRKLPPLAKSYFEEGRLLMRGGWSSAEFHQFRLRTKRLRYTLEMFRSCYGPGLERCLGALRGLQDFLGEISDCATIEQLTRRSRDRRRIDRLLAARTRAATRGLKKHWREEFDRPGEEQRWTGYLARRAH
jgi:CHAD domain-containing protein